VTGPSAIERVARRLAAGEPAVIPTDTVYGLAADPRQPAAVARLFELKGRPESNPIPLLVPDEDAARGAASEWPDGARALARTFWPGPLTIVVPAASWLSPEITAGTGAVGVRAPKHPLALALLRRVGPLACTSANHSGEPPARSPAELPPDWGSDRVALLDAGELPPADASTVIDLAAGDAPTLRREGPIALERLMAAIRSE